MNFFYVAFLGFVVSLDSFGAGVAYGLKKITISLKSLATVGLITALCTGLAMVAALVIGQFVNTQLTAVAGALLLITIGLFSVFQEYLTRGVRPCDHDSMSVRQLTFSVGKLVVTIMAKPESADLDHSQSISPLEGLLLGLALGVDNMVATFATELTGALPIYTPLVMGIIQMLFLATGYWASSHLASASFKKHFSYLPGTILILIGLLRLR